MLHRLCAAALVLAAGAAPETKTAPVMAAAQVPAAVMPIREVTVYSDRARVIRRGEMAVVNKAATRLAVLPATLDPGSVRLEAEGGVVERVEVRRAGRDEFPRTEAEKLVRELETAQDMSAALGEKMQTLARERDLLQGLRPSASPQPDPKIAPVLLEPAGWRGAVAFLDARAATIEDNLRGLSAQMLAQQKKTQQLLEQAQQLASVAGDNPGWVVEAWLGGKGTAKLALTYQTWGARWYPAYDVRFNPGKGEVEVGFAALTAQQTGEDWLEARMTFSTAVPSNTATLPKLLAWKIGERDQFIPTPVAQPEPPQPAPPSPRLDDASRGRFDRDQVLRNRLRELAASERQAEFESRAVRGFGQAVATDRDADGIPDAADFQELEKKGFKAENAPPAPPPPPPAKPKVSLPMGAAASPAPTRSRVMAGEALSLPAEPMPTQGVALTGQLGWIAPSYAADLPAALAGGYDFSYSSARPETVRSGGESRRVALHTARFPAKAQLAIYPALRKHAYLVAEVTNSSDRPLLQGRANLFVGADLQGQALIPTTAANEKLTVPLGVDEGVQLERNVNVITKEKGLISKDDVTTYEVVIELLNPRATDLDARVVDQLPLPGDKSVDIKLDKMEPWALRDDQGSLEWRLTLRPGTKQVIRFVYTVTRSRGAKLRQW